MLEKIKISQFGGINTILDSANAGVSEVRECRNFILRPIGGLGVPAAWTPFALGGLEIDFGFFVDYYFPFTSRLILQSEDGRFFHITTDSENRVYALPIADPVATPQTANIEVGQDEAIGFASTYGIIELNANLENGGCFFENIGNVTFKTTQFDGDIVFTYASGFSVFIEDLDGNTWKLFVDNEGGLDAITV